MSLKRCVMIVIAFQFLTCWLAQLATAQTQSSRAATASSYLERGNQWVARGEWERAIADFDLGGEWKQHSETHPSILFGGGAIVSTPNDLAKFIQALFDGKIVSKESFMSRATP